MFKKKPMSKKYTQKVSTPSKDTIETMNEDLPIKDNSDETDLFHQDVFRQLVITERKRTERSKIPFLLILTDVRDLLTDQESIENNLKKISAVIKKNSREVDIRGWFEQMHVVGIILPYTTFAFKDVIINKLKNGFVEQMGSLSASLLKFACFCFPDDYAGDKDKENVKGDKTGTSVVSNSHVYYAQENQNSMMQNSLRKFFFITKRFVDICGSIFGIILFSPVFLIVPVIIKLSSPGPIFFRQKRVGQGGKLFKMLKFRSMYFKSDESVHKDFVTQFIKGTTVQTNGAGDGFNKMKNDKRVTPIGRFLRKTSFDEIPQLFNILRGEMSLVGPRPAIPYEIEQYDLWHKRRILEAKPGLTGLWQVKGRSLTSFDGMVRMDIRYITNPSVLSDISLILQTPWAMLTAKGAC